MLPELHSGPVEWGYPAHSHWSLILGLAWGQDRATPEDRRDGEGTKSEMGEKRQIGKAGRASDRKGGHPAGFLGGKGAPLKGGKGWGLRGQGEPHLSHIFMSTFIFLVHAERTTCLHGLSADTMPPGTGWPQRLPWASQPVHTAPPPASSGTEVAPAHVKTGRPTSPEMTFSCLHPWP